VYVVWGSTYLAIRVMVETMPPLLSAGLRFLLAGVVLYGWLWFHGGTPRLRIGRRELLACLLIGILFFPGGNGLVTLAETEAPSGLAALIIAAIPLWVIVFRLVGRERVPRVTLLGVGAGFVGVGILVARGRTRQASPCGARSRSSPPRSAGRWDRSSPRGRRSRVTSSSRPRRSRSSVGSFSW